MQQLKSFWSRISGNTPFQVLSDLHLEVGRQYDTYEVPPCAPYLILAGDIGRLADYDEYLSFLKRHIERFRLIFLVLGNHEFYGLGFDEGLRRAEKLEAEKVLSKKVVLLHQKRHDISELGVIVLGCTLWSAIPTESEEIVTSRINDFKRIKAWSTKEHNAAHEADLNWLKDQVTRIQKQSGKDKTSRGILVVTHHAPCKEDTSSPEYTNNAWNSAFATDLFNGADWSGVKVWVFGHTHYTTEFSRDGIRVIANQRGYVLNPHQEDKGGNAFNSRRVIKWRET